MEKRKHMLLGTNTICTNKEEIKEVIIHKDARHIIL